MIFSSLSTPLLGMVDTAVVGHLDEPHYLGAVAVGATIFGIIFWGFGFLRMGTSGLTAQSWGARAGDEVRAILGRGLLLALGIGLLLIITQQLSAQISFVFFDLTDQVAASAQTYYSIRIASAPAVLANYVLLGWFLGMQDIRANVILLIAINLINMVLDLLFVYGFGMDVDGVALASALAEYSGVLIGLILVRLQLRRYAGSWSKAQLIDWQSLKKMFAVNRDIFFRTLMLMFSLAFFTAQSAKHGEAILAANAVLINFQTFMAYGLDGFAYAAQALIGRYLGEQNKTLLKQTAVAIFIWSQVVAVLFCLIYFLLGSEIILLLTSIESVVQAANVYLPWMILSPLISVWSFYYDGVFIGATLTREMRNTMLFSMLTYLLAWWFLLPWGNHGLWMALMVFMLARCVSMAWVLRRKNIFK